MCRATFETSEAAADAVANFQKGTIKYAWCATCCCNRTATCSNVVFQQVHVAMSYSSLPCILLFFHSRIRFWLSYLPWHYKKVLHTSFPVPKIRFLGRTYHSFGDLIFSTGSLSFDYVSFETRYFQMTYFVAWMTPSLGLKLSLRFCIATARLGFAWWRRPQRPANE